MQSQHATPTPDAALRAMRDIELQLESDGRAGLYPLLAAAHGARIGGRYRVGELFAAGRQVFVFHVVDEETGQPAVAKQAAFDYRDPLSYGRREAAALRAPLLREFEVQSACQSGHMSRPLALVRGAAIVPEGAESAVLGREEVFVIQERLDARPLSEVALQRWTQRDLAARERAAAGVAREFIRFWQDLFARGWMYTDVNAANLLLDAHDRLFVVDAAGAVRSSSAFVSPGLSPAFATPRLWERAVQRQPLAGDLSSVLPLLAKVLHFGLSTKTPFNGALPALDALAAYSPACRDALGAMLGLDAAPERLPEALQTLSRVGWR